MLAKGIREYLHTPPAPINSYKIVSEDGPTLAASGPRNTPFTLSIIGNDTLRLESLGSENIGTVRTVVALEAIIAVQFSAENELTLMVSG
jgi:hypothetical protein